MTRARLVAAGVVAMLAAGLVLASPAFAATLTVTPNAARSGDTVTIRGSGFLPNDFVTVRDNGIVISTNVLTDNQGSFSLPYTVPPNSNTGNHIIDATDRQGTTAAT